MNEHEQLWEVAWEIVRAVATEDMTYASECSGDLSCIFCMSERNYDAWDNVKHTADCLVLKARALVQQHEQGTI